MSHSQVLMQPSFFHEPRLLIGMIFCSNMCSHAHLLLVLQPVGDAQLVDCYCMKHGL